MQVTISDDIGACGTSLQGILNISYGEIVAKLGEPTSDGDGYKVDAEWTLEFEDGTIATIYNYKTGPNYNGSGDWNVEDIRAWHIGGAWQGGFRALTLVNELFADDGWEVLRLDGPVS